MKLYLSRHLSKIEVISQLYQMLSDHILLYGENSNSFDNYYYYYTIDPVKNFIRMCLSDESSNDELDDGILNYLIKLFYSVKGTPKVLEYMESELGLIFIPDSITGEKFNYSESSISFNIESIKSFNLNSFMEAQSKFLGSLLYYYDLTSMVDEAKLYITDELESDISITTWTYTQNDVGNS